jgi:hypothetical protein
MTQQKFHPLFNNSFYTGSGYRKATKISKEQLRGNKYIYIYIVFFSVRDRPLFLFLPFPVLFKVSEGSQSRQTVKYGLSPVGPGTKQTVLARASSNLAVSQLTELRQMTDPTSRQRGRPTSTKQ